MARGRLGDNRSTIENVKSEEIYLKAYATGADGDAGLNAYFHYATRARTTEAWTIRRLGRLCKPQPGAHTFDHLSMTAP